MSKDEIIEAFLRGVDPHSIVGHLAVFDVYYDDVGAKYAVATMRHKWRVGEYGDSHAKGAVLGAAYSLLDQLKHVSVHRTDGVVLAALSNPDYVQVIEA